MLKIWGRPTSICTQRVLWACAEAGLKYHFQLASATMGAEGHISTGAEPFGSVNTDWYRRMNPNGTVPTIDDDGFQLWESNAIVGYLARRYASEQLFDNDEGVFARGWQWLSWTNERLEPLLHTLVMEVVRLRADMRSAAALAEAREALKIPVTILEEHLAGQSYVAGEAFSMGDIAPGATLYRSQLLDSFPMGFPHVERWLNRLQQRPGFIRHVAPRECHI